MTTIERKGYKIIRYSFLKFWLIDTLEFNLPSRYLNAYEEVEKKLYLQSLDGSYTSINTWSTNLKSYVVEDIRQQLSAKILNHEKLVKKDKRLIVNFDTKENNSYYQSNSMNFYIIDGVIYFDSDKVIKREKILNQLGIK
jgi:hypothetical protein